MRRLGLALAAALILSVTVGASPALAAVPSAPAQPTATPMNAAAKVTWVAPANGGHTITQYIVTPFVGATAKMPRVFNSAATSQVITGLSNGVGYTFKVKAHNQSGTGANSPASSSVKIGTPVAPAKPVVAIGNALVRVNWNPPANNGSNLIGYVVTPFIGTVAQTAHTFNATALSQNITGLTNGVSYTFKVAAKNARGTGPVSVASAAAKPTGQPTLKLAMNTTIGKSILVDSRGMTVYMYGPDADATLTKSNVSGALRTAWPYVTWGGAITVGTGLTLGKATANIQNDNTRLLAYNGHLLYLWTGDHVPGDATGHCIGSFSVLDANGAKVAC